MGRDFPYALVVKRKTNTDGAWPIRRYPQIRIQRIDEQRGALVGYVFRKQFDRPLICAQPQRAIQRVIGILLESVGDND